MVSREAAAIVSTIAASGMFIVAWSEFAHGTPAAEVHLITAAPLTIGSTILFTGAGYHQNAIIEAEYRAPPDTTPLPNDGMIQPSSALAGPI